MSLTLRMKLLGMPVLRLRRGKLSVIYGGRSDECASGGNSGEGGGGNSGERGRCGNCGGSGKGN